MCRHVISEAPRAFAASARNGGRREAERRCVRLAATSCVMRLAAVWRAALAGVVVRGRGAV